MSKESLILNPNEITPIANGKPKTKNRNVSISTEAQLIGDNETVVIDIATNLHDESKDNGNIIKINISGTHFETFERTLERFPQSLLGNREKRNELHRNENGEIFIDRNSRIFERVLTFYQTGLLEEPPNINRSIFIRDVRYYGLDEEASECGMAGFRLASYKDFPQRKWQAFLWNLLEYPQSSKGAKIISALSIIIIFLSIIVFCWETIPEIRHGKHKEIKEGLNVVEKFCIAYFTLEFILRLVASPNKVRFMCSILNIIDLLAILPFYVTTAFQIEGGVSIYFLRTVRLVRVFRIFKLSRYSGEMKILGKALNDSARELAVLVFFIMLGVLVFSSAGFYAEEDDDRSVFSSIPHAFWWSIVTMTTVGYGDEVPKSIRKFQRIHLKFHNYAR